MQLNDTHPSIGVAELMRLLMDEYHLGWTLAWWVPLPTARRPPPRCLVQRRRSLRGAAH